MCLVIWSTYPFPPGNTFCMMLILRAIKNSTHFFAIKNLTHFCIFVGIGTCAAFLHVRIR